MENVNPHIVYDPGFTDNNYIAAFMAIALVVLVAAALITGRN